MSVISEKKYEVFGGTLALCFWEAWGPGPRAFPLIRPCW